MYGTAENQRFNLKMFFVDSALYVPAMTLISVATVIPYFLEQYGASAMQIGLAASLALICSVVPLPVFGSIASRTRMMGKTFAKILLLQRLIFMLFIFSIPLFVPHPAVMVILFLVFWSIFNVFVASYSVFYTPLVLKLLPPEKRGGVRGMGSAAGSLLGMGMAALIPVIFSNIPAPYDYMLIFFIGILFLLADCVVFLSFREHEDAAPREYIRTLQYIRRMPETLSESAAFRTMVLTCTFLAITNYTLTFYTLYAIKTFRATESHIAALAALAVMSNAIGYVLFGKVVDRRGPVAAIALSSALVLAAGAVALVSNSLTWLFVAWVLANLAYACYMISASLLPGELDTKGKLPLYIGVMTIIPLAISSVVLLVLAPMLESYGFHLLFITVAACGAVSLLLNVFILRRRLRKEGEAEQAHRDRVFGDPL